jgi:diguanylate cyclase (GGDEF)-like protein
VVTYIRPGFGFYLQDGNNGTLVNTRSAVAIPIGAQVEAVGYPTPARFSPTLDDATYRIIGPSHPVAPLQQTASAMLSTDQDGTLAVPYDSLLVQLTGVLVDEDLVSTSSEDELILKDGERVFTAQLSHDAARNLSLVPGSVLSLTGICVGRMVESRGEGTFAILLRSPADIVVVRNAPWLNAAHARWLVVVTLAVALVVFFVIVDMRKHSESRSLAMTDPLTGLYNRRGFLMVAESNWQAAQRSKAALLFFYFDIDDFREINVGLGNKEGDRALQAVGEVLRECFRTTDILARVGGDEFAVLCSANANSQETIVERVQAALNRSNEQDGRRIPVSISIEKLVCDDSMRESSMVELLQRADSQRKEKRAARNKA